MKAIANRMTLAARIRKLAEQRIRMAERDDKEEREYRRFRDIKGRASPSIYWQDAARFSRIARHIAAGNLIGARGILRRLDTAPCDDVLVKLGKRVSKQLGWELK